MSRGGREVQCYRLLPPSRAPGRAGTRSYAGVFNIISALQWDIPMPVQPMKSISAVAIADGLSPGAFAASGIITGGVVWILGPLHWGSITRQPNSSHV